MKTRSVGMYKIGEKQKEEDEEGMLFSMVLEFKKDNSFVKDATSLLPTHNPVADEEVLCGIKIIDKISNASHIDDILEKNIELYNTLKQSILSLLDEAGYDIKCYPYWLDNINSLISWAIPLAKREGTPLPIILNFCVNGILWGKIKSLGKDWIANVSATLNRLGLYECKCTSLLPYAAVGEYPASSSVFFHIIIINFVAVCFY